MSLFPIDVALLAHARTSSASHLSARVNEAVASAVTHVGSADASPEEFDRAAELVVAAITALVARDKFGPAQQLRPEGVLAAAKSAFPGYFDWIADLREEEHHTLLNLIASLGLDINYAGLDPTVVSRVYEEALVSEASQRELGVYYTPPDLAQRIARQLPIEELPPDERVVLDPACGSGSLLLAAYDRLHGAVPGDLDPLRRHQYAKSHLIGFDSDKFAVQIARLALLLHAMPAGNEWHVERRSIEQLDDALPTRPRVIFSNPPWRTLRWQGEGRSELADRFLLAMLELLEPGGYLAAILPASWLTSASSVDTRDALARKAGVFEIWRLPRDTFGSSNLTPCVVFAQSERKSTSFVFRRMLPRGDWKSRFYRAGIADESYLSLEARPPHTWVRGPLDSARKILDQLPKLSDVAAIQLGPPPREPVRERGGEGRDLWLRRARDLPAFGEPPEHKLVRIRYPEEFSKRTEGRGLLDRHKILVSSMSTGDVAWRLKVGFDLRGIIPRQSLFMVVPHDDDDTTLQALAAILASSVASAWVGALAPRLHIRTGFLSSLPVPHLETWRQPLAAIAATLRNEQKVGAIRLETLLHLETTVLDAYGLPVATREALTRLFGGERAPDGHVRFPAPSASEASTGHGTRHFGAVFEVAEERLKLWLPGYSGSDGDWVTIPPSFPGWLCTPGRTFEAIVGADGLAGARYEYQSRSFLELDQLRDVVRRTA